MFCFGPRWFPFGSVSVRFGSCSVLLRPLLVSIRFCVGSLWFSFGTASPPFWFPFGSASVRFGSHSVLLRPPLGSNLFWFGSLSVLLRSTLVPSRFCFGPPWVLVRFCFGPLGFLFGSASPPFGFHSVLFRFALVRVRCCFGPLRWLVGSVLIRWISHVLGTCEINRRFFVKPLFGPRYFFCRTSRQGPPAFERGRGRFSRFIGFRIEFVGLFYDFHDFYFF